MRKVEIRKKILKKRRKQSFLERKKKSLIIWKKLKQEPEFKRAKTVMFYLSLPDEVWTDTMVKQSIKMGKKVVVPVTLLKERRLKISILKNYEHELEHGPFNIPQPRKECIRKVSPHEIDLVIVPGVGFDQRCGRLGFGKGFYDRFLKSLKKNVSKIALAYDFQVVKSLPLEKNDVFVDRIITEKRTITLERKEGD